MPYNGSGVYVAPSLPGSFNPAQLGQQATPADWNTFLADLSTALSTAITKDGQTTITANLPMATFRHTGVGNAVAATDYLAAGQALGTLNGAADTGAADAYAIAPTIAIASYVAYQRFQFVAANANTGAATLAVSGLATKAIKHLDGTALLAGDILAGEMVDVGYDGTNFQLFSATGLRGTANIWAAPQTFNASVVLAAVTTMSAKPINEAKGTNIASATTTDIGAAIGNYVHVTGVTTITGLGTIQAGTRRKVVFDGILLLTYNATSLILPTAANITTAAGDSAEFESEGSGNWKCTQYLRASGLPLVVPTGSLGANGYEISTTGLITQWGTSASINAGSSGVVTFPVAFTTALYSFVFSGIAAQSSAQASNYYDTTSTTVATIHNQGASASTFTWIATGK